MTESAIKFNNLKYSDKNSNLELDLSIKESELVCVIGPSKSNKQAMLSLLCGFCAPSSGSIEIKGQDICSLKSEERKVGLVTSQTQLFPKLNVEQNIAYPLKKKKADSNAIKAESTALMVMLEITDIASSYPQDLSLEQTIKVSLARALAAKPQVLVLDELFLGLDSVQKSSLRNKLKDIQKSLGLTTILFTSDLDTAFTLADRLLVLKDGLLEQFDSPDEVYRRPATEFCATFTGQCNLIPYEVILKTLRVPETEKSKVIYQCFGPGHKLFFRPEDMVVNDIPSLPFPEFYPHLRFENAKILRTEYLGKEYLVTAQFDEIVIRAYTSYKPSSDYITAGVRMSKILEFNNGRLTRH